jgi:hypothetical protein
MRLVDASATLPEIAPALIAVAGHSRLGKAALIAAACDPRIAAVCAVQSGCGGAAPEAHPVGETRAQMHERFPHWALPPGSAPFDQHELLALVAPRPLWLAQAEEDLWADPLGSLAALAAAAPAWGLAPDWDPALAWPAPATRRAGPIGWTLRAGPHDLTPADWEGFLDHLAACGWP